MHTTSFLENLVFTDPLSDLCLFAAITSQWSEYKLVIVTGMLMPFRNFNLFPVLYSNIKLQYHTLTYYFPYCHMIRPKFNCKLQYKKC